MIHQPIAGFQGQASDIDIHAREVLQSCAIASMKILAKHTNQTTLDRIADGHATGTIS